MHADVDKERVRRLARELLEALGEDADSDDWEKATGKDLIPDEDIVYTTVQVARILGVSQAWVTAHVREFPGAFRMSGGQRANYRFPKATVDEYKRKKAV